MRWGVVLICLLSLGGCVGSSAITCADGRVCPATTVCDDVHRGCALPDQISACAGMAELAPCSYPGVPEGACFEGVCLQSGCGNGVVNGAEQCDDGNRFHGDGCSADCLSTEMCGNGFVDAVKGEACDDGNQLDGDGCQANCSSPTCGDGIVDPDRTELCDAGPANSDAIDAACRTNCLPRRCGDGIEDTGELCDDGNVTAGDGCSADCTSLEGCGNGYLDVATNEQCDDGNNADSDGCQGNCKISRCGDGIVDDELLEQCDEGSANSAVADAECRLDCTPRRCGDGTEDSGEVCDDGNLAALDGCTPDCLSDETCGNSYRDEIKGEACDDGDLQSHDGCRGCRSELPVWRAAGPRAPGSRNQHALAYDAARGRIVMFGGDDDGTDVGDTWEWDGSVWNEVTPTAGGPLARYGHALAFVASRGRVVLFGGRRASSTFGDTWEWGGLAWTKVTSGTSNPAARSGHALAYDAARDRLVLFGGRSATGVFLADTWEWNGSAWIDVSPTSANPTARAEHAVAYDPARGRVVLFGGVGSAGELADTWEWSGTAWTQLTPGAGPTARRGNALAFDAARGRVVLFGGESSGTALADLWELDGATWTDVTPSSGSAPVARRRHALGYDIARGRTVLFGGTATASLADTWEWSGTAWIDTTPAPASPPASASYGITYDSARGRVVMLGGGYSPPSADTWEWDGARWILAAPAASSPPARGYNGLAYDAARKVVVLFGGYTGTNGVYYKDTWEWDGSVWSNVTPASPGPEDRGGYAVAYDPLRARVVLFGGGNSYKSYNDTWEWSGTAWQNVTPASGNPMGRSGHALVWDPVRQRIVMYGGWVPFVGQSGETWEWNGTSWTNVTPASGNPPVRGDHGLTFDAARGRVVMFSGWTSGPSVDMWQWDGVSWTNVTPATGSPNPRYAVSLVYDAARGKTVLFGGRSNSGDLSDTWTLRYESSASEPDERCAWGLDGDNDGLVGCADPDCFGYCTPSCNPTLMTCGSGSPRCGDGACQPIESKRLCPADCTAPTAICGDFICDAPETVGTCPGDCS